MKFLLILSLFCLTVLQSQVKLKLSPGGSTLPLQPPIVTPGTGSFTFTINTTLHTSAGVFKDSFLVKTLWSNIVMTAGTYTKSWDGMDDNGHFITAIDNTYHVKICTNKVQYTWQGTIGNTSDSMTGPAKHRGYKACMTGLAFGPTYGYFCTGYSERSPSMGKFKIATLNQKINPFFNPGDNTPVLDYVATDGIKVYWAGYDASHNNNTFIFGTKVFNDEEVSFSSGVAYALTFSRTFPSVIAKSTATHSTITGLAVQKTGSYLFVARAGLNQLLIVDKTTGSVVNTLTYTNPRGLSVDKYDNLWMITGTNTVTKYSPVAGALTAGITLPGLLDPLATQVSIDGTLISVADGSTSQQVKFFNNSTGMLTNILGTAGGYLSDARVNDHKFYFNDVNGRLLPFISYQPDGTFWVSDPGNYRVQHYDASRRFVNRIMSMPATYAVYADKNNINKVFSNFLEFQIDYTQKLSGSAGWQLKNNWGANVSAVTYKSFNFMPQYSTTLSNGRTYALMDRGNNLLEVIEFASNNQLRFTGIIKPKVVLCDDGSLQQFTSVGNVGTFKRYPLTGFDASGNPVWSSTAEILATGVMNVFPATPVVAPRSQIFSGNKVALYNYHAALPTWYAFFNPNTPGYHLGLMQRGANNTYLFQTEKSTPRSYQWTYPSPGWFDTGNGVSDGAGGNVNIVDSNIITSYHGEFWKGQQTNKYNHYYYDGLAIGQFGVTRQDIGGYGVPAAAQMAGNALTPTLVKDGNGNLYLWHGDESDHSGIHRWKITGLNTIHEIDTTLQFPGSYYRPSINYTDLMAGLPFSQSLKNNTSGWTRSPVSDTLINGNTNNWLVSTNVINYDPDPSHDLYIRFSQPTAQTYHVSRDLGSNNVSKNWKISGSISFTVVGGVLNGNANNAYLEVLDDAGKVLTIFYALADLATSGVRKTKVFGNTTLLYNISEASRGATIGPALMSNLNPFEIIIAAGVVTFSYAGHTHTTRIFDRYANWHKPTTLRIRFNSLGSGANQNVRYGITDLKFYKDIL